MTTTISDADSLASLRSKIDRASQLYYTSGLQSHLTDAQYDEMLQQLREVCPDDERLTRVGPKYNSADLRTKHKHQYPMGSLDNTKGGIEGFADWYRNICTKLGKKPALIVSYKMDGNSISIDYVNGKLVRALTRGDGLVGDEVTSNAVLWKGVPTELSEPTTMVVRGEAILETPDFEELNADGTYENPRNLCNGIIGRKDGEDNERIWFRPFNLQTADPIVDQLDYNFRLDLLKMHGFNPVTYWLFEQPNEVVEFFESLEAKEFGGGGGRAELPFQIDGVVAAVDNIDDCRSFGQTEQDAMRPKYARAIKFTTAKATTKVIGCTITMGHTGALIPTADLEPVRIGGVTVDSALLNNWNAASAMPSAAHVAIGDEVVVELAGDIIPKITMVSNPVFIHPIDLFAGDCAALASQYGPVEFEDDAPGADPLPGTEHCQFRYKRPYVHGPNCSADVYLERPTIAEPKMWEGQPTSRIRRGKETAATYAQVDEASLTRRKIEHFIKKTGIKGIGDGLLTVLTHGDRSQSRPLVSTPSDLYELKADDLAYLYIGSGMLGMSRAEQVVESIQKHKSLPLAKFLGALGVDLLGERRAKLIMDEVPELNSIDAWMDPTKTSLIRGETTRREVSMGIQQALPIIRNLLSVGVTAGGARIPVGTSETKDKPMNTATSTQFAGKSFCFTGTRDGVEEVEAAGGIIKSGVSKGLNYLVQKSAESQSSKTLKAEQYGAKIISLQTLKDALAGTRELPTTD